MDKKRKGQLIRLAITLPIVIAITWYFFTNVYIYPKIELWRDGNRMNTTLVEIKDGYTFADEPYTVQETVNGYDVIIHLEEK